MLGEGEVVGIEGGHTGSARTDIFAELVGTEGRQRLGLWGRGRHIVGSSHDMEE